MTLDMNRLIDNAVSTGTVTTASNLFVPSVTGPVYDVPFTKGVPRITPFGCDNATTAVVLPTANFALRKMGRIPSRWVTMPAAASKSGTRQARQRVWQKNFSEKPFTSHLFGTRLTLQKAMCAS